MRDEDPTIPSMSRGRAASSPLAGDALAEAVIERRRSDFRSSLSRLLAVLFDPPPWRTPLMLSILRRNLQSCLQRNCRRRKPPATTPPAQLNAAARPPDWSVTARRRRDTAAVRAGFRKSDGEQAFAWAKFPMAIQEGKWKGQPTDLPTLQAQSAAERARLGPAASSVADTLGYYASPTTLLNAIPYAGGRLAGPAHEGIKSAFER